MSGLSDPEALVEHQCKKGLTDSGGAQGHEGAPGYEGTPGYKGSQESQGAQGYGGAPGYGGTPGYDKVPTKLLDSYGVNPKEETKVQTKDAMGGLSLLGRAISKPLKDKKNTESAESQEYFRISQPRLYQRRQQLEPERQQRPQQLQWQLRQIQRLQRFQQLQRLQQHLQQYQKKFNHQQPLVTDYSSQRLPQVDSSLLAPVGPPHVRPRPLLMPTSTAVAKQQYFRPLLPPTSQPYSGLSPAANLSVATTLSAEESVKGKHKLVQEKEMEDLVSQPSNVDDTLKSAKLSRLVGDTESPHQVTAGGKLKLTPVEELDDDLFSDLSDLDKYPVKEAHTQAHRNQEGRGSLEIKNRDKAAEEMAHSHSSKVSMDDAKRPHKARTKRSKADVSSDSGVDSLSEITSNASLAGASTISPLPNVSDRRRTKKGVTVAELTLQTGDDIMSLIFHVLDTNDIPYYQVMHTPGVENEIEIIGKGVERLNKELTLVAANKGYKVVIKDVDFGPYAEIMPSTTQWIKLCGGIRATGTFALGIADHPLSVIDAIMQGRDKKRRHSQIEYFGMTTAHSFLTEAQNKKLMASTQHFTGVHHEVIIKAYEEDFYMSVKGNDDIDIVGTPRLLYKYWIPRNVQGEWAAMQDIAFFKLDNDQIRSGGLVDSSNIDVTGAAQHQWSNEEAFIVSIHSLEGLREHDGHRISCAGKSGLIIKGPNIHQAGHTIGNHLAFILDGNERLREGDCGSFLCLEPRDKGKIPILGMFIGQLKSNNRIHQAVILSWNIQQVEATPRLKISDINLAEASLDFDGINSADTGYGT